jgi:serine/threonine protein kinase
MLSWRGYKAAVDIWSAGCILSELLTGRVLFPGIDHVHHINLIFELLGTPGDALLDRVCGQKTKEYLQMLPKSNGTDIRTLYGPDIPDDALDLLKRMLLFDPSERCSVGEALKHPFFDPVRHPALEDLGESPGVYHGAFNELGLEELRRLILEEAALFARR